MSSLGKYGIDRFMHTLGGIELIPSTEEVPTSVWVTEDSAPGGVAGYYEKKHLPIPHVLTNDGANAARLTFTLKNVDYDLHCRHSKTHGENLEIIVDILHTIMRWERQGIVGFVAGLAPFRKRGGEWWRILRIAPDANESEIRAAFHHLALTHHPDRGGNIEEFKRLQQAYSQGLDRTPTGGVVG